MLSNIKKRILDTYMEDGTPKDRISPAKFDIFKNYLDNSIETIEQLNHKPIMGYVPDSKYYFKDLVRLYADKGVNTFYFDAHPANPITLQSSLRAFMRALNEYNILEKSFIYMINSGYGRIKRNSNVIPAKNILGFGFGIDGLGERHQALHPKAVENMRNEPDNRARLFNKETYGYLVTSDRNEIREFYPNDSGIDVSHLITSDEPDRKIQNSFNMEQLALESMHLQERIANFDPMLQYLTTKSNVKKEDVQILKRAKIRQAR